MEYFGLTTDAYRGLLLKPVGKGPVARTRHRWEDNKKKEFSLNSMRSRTALILLNVW